LLRLDERKNHQKYWRPSIILLADGLDGPLIEFCNNMKKGGLYVIANLLVGDFQKLAKLATRTRKAWQHLIDASHIKAFPQVSVSKDARSGFRNLILCSGLGGMNANTVVIPLYSDVADDTSGSSMESKSGDISDEGYRSYEMAADRWRSGLGHPLMQRMRC